MGFFIIFMMIVVAVGLIAFIRGLGSTNNDLSKKNAARSSRDTTSTDRFVQNILSASKYLRAFLDKVDRNPHAEYILDHVSLGDDFSEESVEISTSTPGATLPRSGSSTKI